MELYPCHARVNLVTSHMRLFFLPLFVQSYTFFFHSFVKLKQVLLYPVLIHCGKPILHAAVQVFELVGSRQSHHELGPGVASASACLCFVDIQEFQSVISDYILIFD